MFLANPHCGGRCCINEPNLWPNLCLIFGAYGIKNSNYLWLLVFKQYNKLWYVGAKLKRGNDKGTVDKI